MTQQQKTATLTEWMAKLNNLLDEMMEDGVDIEFTTCCCGEGMYLTRDAEFAYLD